MRYASTNVNLTKSALAGARIDASCGVKTCTSCGVLKPLDAYASDPAGIGSVGSVCAHCRTTYGKTRRSHKQETDVIFRVNKVILKRQAHGTHVCLLSDESAYRATAHLTDDLGFMSVADSHTFRTIFAANNPEKIKLVEEKARASSAAKAARKLASEKRAMDRAMDRDLAKCVAKLAERGAPRTMELTHVNIERLIYRRMQHHLKNKRRKLKATDFSFTKANFTCITGYTPGELRQHLDKRIPVGKTWADVVSGDLHIEHIVPSAAFDLTTVGGIRLCYALSNLTLLPGYENSSKGGTADKATAAFFRDDTELARLFGLVE